MRYIGLLGKAGSGKDLVGRCLKTNLMYPDGAAMFAFAKRVKDTMCTMFPAMDRARLDFDTEYKEGFAIEAFWFNMTRRQIMQKLGTDLKNIMGDQLWINIMEQEIRDKIECSPFRYCIVTDVRFVQEMHWVWDNGGVLIRVNRIATEETLTKSFNHISETALKDFHDEDFIVNNVVDPLDPDESHAKLLRQIKDDLIPSIKAWFEEEEKHEVH